MSQHTSRHPPETFTARSYHLVPLRMSQMCITYTLAHHQTSSMLSPKVVRSIFDRGPLDAKNPYLDVRYPYDGHYNKLLSKAFPMIQFFSSIAFLDHNLHTMVIQLKTTPTTQCPVFILLIAPDNTPVTSKDAEVAMLELLKGADAHGIKVIHGVCVYGPQAAFYQYDRERQVVSPEPQGQVHFDLDLATESGARRFVEVTEHVEQMCRELVPDLELPSFYGS